MKKRRGYVSTTVDVDVDVSEVLDQVSDEDLLDEVNERRLGAAGNTMADTLREWRDALERGDNPMRVAASIRAFMFNELPPVQVEMPKRLQS